MGVDGIELSQDMVDRLREKPGGDQIEVVMGDMSRVGTGRTYGLVYLVFNTIGNLLGQDDQVRCFDTARHLTDDGVFVLECRVPTAPAHPSRQFVEEELELDRVGLGVCRYDPLSQILDVNHVRLGPDGVGARSDPVASGLSAGVRPDGPTGWTAAAGAVGRLAW